MEAMCLLCLLAQGAELAKAGVGATLGQPTGMLHLIPLLGWLEGAHCPCGVHLGTAKVRQLGKPPVKLLQHPREEEEFLLHPKVSCVHSEAPPQLQSADASKAIC